MKTQAWIDRKNRAGLFRCEMCGARVPQSEMEWSDKHSQTGTCKRCASVLTGKSDIGKVGEE